MAFASMSSNNEERNKELVRELWEDVNAGNLDVLNEHPGLAEIVPFVARSRQMLEDTGHDTQEILADGDWVMMRDILWGTPTQEFMGAKAGERNHMETIGMYLVRDGKIVDQHSQIGPHQHPHPDEPGTNVPKRSGMAQKEANKALVRSVINKVYGGNPDVLALHPGLGDLGAAVSRTLQQLGDRKPEIKEVLADGDWVVTRVLLGDTETLSMYRVDNGKIVQQHEQTGPYAR